MQDTSLIPVTSIAEVPPAKRSLRRISQAARPIARQHALRKYHETLTENTLKRHKGDLRVFSKFLEAAGEEIEVHSLMYDLTTWEGVNEGLLEGFKDWMLDEGYSIGSVNVRLSTIKKYCEVAAKGGIVEPSDLGLISKVYGYRGKEGRNIDAKRTLTRVGNKKGAPIVLTSEQVEQLLSQDDSRDALLMYLFLRLGFRVGEVAALEIANIDLKAGHIKLYRQKTDIEQTHDLRWGGLELMHKYLAEYQPQGKLFTGEKKMHADGTVTVDYTVRAIQKRVKVLGERIGIEHLSPHDCRHDFATRMARKKTHIKDMQDAGGWKSPYMALRYVESSKIANEGVIQ